MNEISSIDTNELVALPENILTQQNFSEAEKLLLQYFLIRKVRDRIDHTAEALIVEKFTGTNTEGEKINQIVNARRIINWQANDCIEKIALLLGIEKKRQTELVNIVYETETHF